MTWPEELTASTELLRPVTLMAPGLEMEKRVVVAEAVEEPMSKRMGLVAPLLAAMENSPQGDEVPIPMDPVVGSWNWVVVAGSTPYIRLPMLSWLLAVALGKKTLEPSPRLPKPVVMVVGPGALLSPTRVLL